MTNTMSQQDVLHNHSTIHMLHVHARRLINKQLNFPAKNSERSHSQFQNETNSALTKQNIDGEINLYCF